jgi:hypothetical protein
MKKEVIGYVISHTGKKGGPWEGKEMPLGRPVMDPTTRIFYTDRKVAEEETADIRDIWPNAKVIPLVKGNSLRQRIQELENETVALVATHRQRIQDLENENVSLSQSLDTARLSLKIAQHGALRPGERGQYDLDSVAAEDGVDEVDSLRERIQEMEEETEALTELCDEAFLRLNKLEVQLTTTPQEPKQYATTSVRLDGTKQDRELAPRLPKDNYNPKGEGWSLVGSQVFESTLFWFWQKG